MNFNFNFPSFPKLNLPSMDPFMSVGKPTLGSDGGTGGDSSRKLPGFYAENRSLIQATGWAMGVAGTMAIVNPSWDESDILILPSAVFGGAALQLFRMALPTNGLKSGVASALALFMGCFPAVPALISSGAWVYANFY